MCLERLSAYMYVCVCVKESLWHFFFKCVLVHGGGCCSMGGWAPQVCCTGFPSKAGRDALAKGRERRGQGHRGGRRG